MGLRRRAACRRSISGVTPCGRLSASPVEVPTDATAGGADVRDLGVRDGALVAIGALVTAAAPAAAGALVAAGALGAEAGRAAGAGRAGASFTRVSGEAAAALAGVAGGAALFGRIAAKSASTRCSFGVMTLSAPRASCLTTRASMTIMIAPTM